MNHKYKQTEIGLIPSDWEVKLVEEISDVKSGKRLPLGKSLSENETLHPYIRVTDMFFGGVSLGEIKFVPNDVFPSIKNYRIFKEDIFISVAGTLGVVGKIPEVLNGANLTENADRLTNIKCDRGFLLYLLMSPLIQNTIESEKTMGAQPKLALIRIRNFQIPLPPTLTEQTAIATALSDADGLITSLEKLIAKKRNIKQGAMQELLRPKEGWVVKKLGEVIEKIIGGGTPSRSNKLYWCGEIPWVTVKDFATFNPCMSQEYITKEGLKNSASHLIPKGTLITSTRMAVGKAIIYQVDVSINQDLKAIFPKSNLDILFLFHWFERNAVSIESLGSGSTVMGISLGELKNIEIALPSTKVAQLAIATILSDMDTEISILEKKLEKAKRVKQGMMQQLLTGKIRLINQTK